MKFHKDFLSLIDSPAKQKIVKFLLKHDASMSEREIASITGLSHMSVNRILREMEAWNVVYFERIGVAHVWKVNRYSYIFEVLSAIYEKIATIPLAIKDLENEIVEALPLKKVVEIVLFGSIAHGIEHENSDIDLFILVKNKTDADSLEVSLDRLSIRCLEKFGNRLSPYVLTQEEYKKNKKGKLIKNINQGIQLFPQLKQ